MKRVLSLMLTLAMVFVLAVPCFAASKGDKDTEEARSVAGVTYDTTSSTVYDPVGNRFKMTGSSSISAYRAVVRTEFSIMNYAGGDPDNILGTNQKVGTDSSSVVFSDGTTTNNYSLNGSSSFSNSAGNYFQRDKTFTGRISSVSCRHYMEASGASSTKTTSGNTYTWMS